jgi:hypothetical protein
MSQVIKIDRKCEDIKYPEEIRMEFICRVLRLFKRALKKDRGADDQGACKDIRDNRYH